MKCYATLLPGKGFFNNKDLTSLLSCSFCLVFLFVPVPAQDGPVKYKKYKAKIVLLREEKKNGEKKLLFLHKPTMSFLLLDLGYGHFVAYYGS